MVQKREQEVEKIINETIFSDISGSEPLFTKEDVESIKVLKSDSKIDELDIEIQKACELDNLNDEKLRKFQDFTKSVIDSNEDAYDIAKRLDEVSIETNKVLKDLTKTKHTGTIPKTKKVDQQLKKQYVKKSKLQNKAGKKDKRSYKEFTIFKIDLNNMPGDVLLGVARAYNKSVDKSVLRLIKEDYMKNSHEVELLKQLKFDIED